MLALLGIGLIDVGDLATGGTARYPEVELAGLAARGVDLVLLPSEPYEFHERHAGEVRDAVRDARVVFLDGRDLFWWGIRTPAAGARLATALAD